MIELQEALAQLPLIAILRGLTLEEAEPMGAALVEAGFCLIEVPLNSPRPFESLERIATRFGESAVVGAGTVLKADAVAGVKDAGGRLIVMPHSDTTVIRAAKVAAMYAIPGFATPTEGFAAHHSGADCLKLFPAEANPPAVLKAMRAVLPKDVPVLPVGGIRPAVMQGYVEAGASGFGLGSALYRPGSSAADVGRRAREFVAAWERAVGIEAA